MIQLPTIVYKSPGSRRNVHGTYDYVGVKTQEEFNRRIANGWHPSQAAAFASVKKNLDIKEVPSPAPITDDQPTRSELEQKAEELGLKFDGRTTDKKLLERIKEALGG